MTTILLVEDHPELRHILQGQLEWMGFSTIPAANGKEGVEKAVAEKPDLIMMNSIMPEMDGWEATRVLRANPQTKDIPILAATAMLQPSARKGMDRHRLQRLHPETIYVGRTPEEDYGYNSV